MEDNIDEHIKEYFTQVPVNEKGAPYTRVIVLHESPDLGWKDISATVPRLCKGWYELARLSSRDRVDFTRDFWLSKLPYHPDMLQCLLDFFASIEDIGVVLAQRAPSEPYEAHMIYALSEGRGFFHGAAGMSSKDGELLQKMYPGTIFPQDYLAFMEIHNGFSKTTDTGIISTLAMPEAHKRFMSLIDPNNPPTSSKGVAVDPLSLIPFYESFGMPFYQCFWKEWYPENEMGNVYYSGSAQTISDVVATDASEENMAFHTFLDWLIFYLDRVE